MLLMNMNKYTRDHKNDTRIHIKVNVYVKVIVRIYIKKLRGVECFN
jgi:hypothetical protein